MKLVVDIPEQTLDRIRKIVQKGEYSDPQEFVVLALENQIAIDSSNGSGESLQSLDKFLSSDAKDQGLSSSFVTDFQRRDYSKINLCDPPDNNRINPGPLWGQYNRLFPVKIIVRQLANTLREIDTTWIELERFQQAVSSNARELGLRLAEIDQELSRGRGAKLSAGLPTGSDPMKSLSRFKEQFVGRIDQNGNLDGASPKLKFVNISFNGEGGQIGLTKMGKTFANLTNPLLDDTLNADSSISNDERKFYLNHLAEYLPAELDAMRMISHNIHAGVDRPEPLSEKVSELNGQWSENQASTIRTGLISRMHELGLITREQVGQRGISYKLTDNGVDFFTRSTEGWA